MPFLYYSAGVYGKRITPRLERVQGLEWQSLSIVHESMAMLRVIVSFGREPYEFNRFREQGEAAVDERVKLTVRQTLFTLLVNTITAAGTAIVLRLRLLPRARGPARDRQADRAHVVRRGRLPAAGADLGLRRAAPRPSSWQLRGSFQLLDTAPEVVEDPTRGAIGRARGDIEYEHVSFSYRGRKDTLHEICFEAAPGSADRDRRADRRRARRR